MKRFTSSPKFENDAAIRRIKSVPQLEVQYLPQSHKQAVIKAERKLGTIFSHLTSLGRVRLESRNKLNKQYQLLNFNLTNCDPKKITVIFFFY